MGSNNAPWHKQHTYVRVYLLPRLSGGLEGPSQSTMTSSQHSQSNGTTVLASCFVGRRLNRKHVMQPSTHLSMSFLSFGHAATLDKMSMVCGANLCPPNAPMCTCRKTQRLHVKFTAASPAGTTGT